MFPDLSNTVLGLNEILRKQKLWAKVKMVANPDDIPIQSFYNSQDFANPIGE